MYYIQGIAAHCKSTVKKVNCTLSVTYACSFKNQARTNLLDIELRSRLACAVAQVSRERSSVCVE